MASFLWWIVGFYWVVSGGDVLLRDAPRLYWYALNLFFNGKDLQLVVHAMYYIFCFLQPRSVKKYNLCLDIFLEFLFFYSFFPDFLESLNLSAYACLFFF